MDIQEILAIVLGLQQKTLQIIIARLRVSLQCSCLMPSHRSRFAGDFLIIIIPKSAISEFGRQKLKRPKTQNPKPKTRNLKLKTQNSKLKTQNSKPKTQNSKPRTQKKFYCATPLFAATKAVSGESATPKHRDTATHLSPLFLSLELGRRETSLVTNAPKHHGRTKWVLQSELHDITVLQIWKPNTNPTS